MLGGDPPATEQLGAERMPISAGRSAWDHASEHGATLEEDSALRIICEKSCVAGKTEPKLLVAGCKSTARKSVVLPHSKE